MGRGMTRRSFGAATLLPVASAFPAQQSTAPVRTIEDFFSDFTAEWVRADPNLATSTRYFSGDEQARLERQLTPHTDAHRRERIRLARQGLAELRKFDRSKLADTLRVSADVMEWQLDLIVRREPFLDYAFPLQQFGGASVALVTALTVAHPLQGEKDADNYVAALGQVGARMNEAADESLRLAGKGILPPKFILLATIRQMQNFVGLSPADNPFVTILSRKMAALKTVPAARQAELRSEAENIVGAEVIPAWKKAIALLESQVPRATDDAGLWRLKGGADAYAYFLHFFTTTSVSPDQVHESGLRQVERIEKQMDTLLRQLGRTAGPLKERIEKLKSDLEYPDPASDASRAQILQDIEGILRDAEKRALSLFNRRPKSPVVVQATPRFRENNAAPRYIPPARDGSRPGTFEYPLDLNDMTRFGLRTTVYHEAVPGHHFQAALQLENTDLPRFRQLWVLGAISALIEGWGLYAERLAAESGWYEGDTEGLLGELYWELYRARRLVVDTGLHTKHWTRQQAIDYGIDPSEVERYVVNPGQACSYMIGALKILELRDKAKKDLGEKFSFQEFHSTVLSTGTVPLEILARQVDAYIRSTH
jgi:uncharacterized protein (DUF885 family)